MMELDIKWLLDACIENDAKAQEALYQKFSGPMFKICLGYAKNREDAKDILQEGFIRVFQRIGTFRNESSLYSWIRKIFVFTSIDYYRKSLKTKFINLSLSFDALEMNTECLSEKMDIAFYHKLIAEMPIGYKLIFNLYALEGYSHKEIAEITGLSEGTSKSQLARARKYLQTKLKTEQEVYFINKDAYEGSPGRLVPAAI